MRARPSLLSLRHRLYSKKGAVKHVCTHQTILCSKCWQGEWKDGYFHGIGELQYENGECDIAYKVGDFCRASRLGSLVPTCHLF